MNLAIEEWGLYNNGILTCKWWDTDVDNYEDIVKYYQNLRKANGIEPFEDIELLIADAEYDVLDIAKENANIEDVIETYRRFEETFDEEQKKAIVAMVENGEDIDYAFQKARSYDYELIDLRKELSPFGKSEVALAQYLIDEGLFGPIPEYLDSYIDYDKLGRDLAMDYNEVEEGLFIRY